MRGQRPSRYDPPHPTPLPVKKRGEGTKWNHLFSFSLIFSLFFPSTGWAIKYDSQTYQRLNREKEIAEKLIRLEAAPFEILLERDLPVTVKSGIQRTVEQTIRTAGEHFGYRTTGAMQILLLQEATYESVEDPRVASSGFYRNKKIRMHFDYKNPGVSEFERIFRHEYTHLVIASIDGGRTPRWLNEGLAEYEERSASGRKPGEGRAFYQKMQKSGQLIPIQDFTGEKLINQYTQNTEYFYQNSYVLAKYLVDQYGFSKLRELFRSMKQGQAFSFALKKVYGMDVERLAQGAYSN